MELGWSRRCLVPAGGVFSMMTVNSVVQAHYMRIYFFFLDKHN